MDQYQFGGESEKNDHNNVKHIHRGPKIQLPNIRFGEQNEQKNVVDRTICLIK